MANDVEPERGEVERFDRFLDDWSRRDVLKRIGGAAAFAAFAAGTLPLAACTTATGPTATNNASQPTVAPIKGGIVTEGATIGPSEFNPVNRLNTGNLVNQPLVLDCLYVPTATSDIEPGLAASPPTISADGLTYTVPLRKNTLWSDGRPLTADDVLFTYNLMLDPQYSAVTSAYRADFKDKVASIQAADPYTVVFRLKSPDAPFLTRLVPIGIAPKHVLSSLSAAQIQTSFADAPSVVNGVFKVVEWKKGDFIRYARNDSYYDGPSLLDGYVYKTVPNTNGQLNQLKTGEIDVAYFTSAGLYDEIKSTPNLNLVLTEALSIHGFAYNLDPAAPASKIFSSKAVRQALLHALDRVGMNKAVYFNYANVQDSTLHASSWAHTETKLRYAYDPKKAADMLEADGWKLGSAGVREKNGVPLKFEAAVTSGSADLPAMFEIMLQNWKQIGAAVSVRPLVTADWVQSTRITRKFDVIYMNLPTTGLDPDQSAGFHSRNTASGGLNAAHYTNPAVDKLLDQAAAVADRAQRKQLYAQIQNILLEDLPRPVLLHAKIGWVYNSRVHGIAAGEIGGNTISGRRPRMNKVFVTK